MKQFTIEMYFAGAPGIAENRITKTVQAESQEAALAALEEEYGVIDSWKAIEPRRATKTKETRDLRPGDVLAFTGEEVLTTPVSLVKSPKGKLEFSVKTKAGSIIAKCWNRHTHIQVLVA